MQVGDGGLVEHTSEPAEDGLPAHFAEEWAALMWPTESLHFLRRAAPAAVLFQNGIHDTNVPPSDALRYQTAANQPKTVIWYDSDHSLPLQAHLDAAVWLQSYLGEDLLWFSPNYRHSALFVDRLFTIWIVTVFASLILFQLDAYRIGSLAAMERVGWTLVILMLGPLGIAIYWQTLRRLKEDNAETNRLPPWAAALAASTIAAANFVTGLVIASLVTNAIHIPDFRVTLILTYSIILASCWAFYLLYRRLYRISTFGLVLNANIAFAITLLLNILTNTTPDLPVRLNPGLWWVASIEIIIILLITYPVHMVLMKKNLVYWGIEIDNHPAPVTRSRYQWLMQTIAIIISFMGLFASITLFVWSQVDLDITQVIALLVGQNP
ncbi:MAG: hypothetical protein MUO67_03240 [Anaerolineales bacterium]|nr:hypothetical protein [Anaerolineales bacterium]